MIRNLRIVGGALSLLLIPFFAFAQVGGVNNANRNLDTFLVKIQQWINVIMPIIIALALLYFLWGVLRYMMASGDEGKRKEAQSVMLFGIIALFVMVSVWGLVSFLASTLGIDQGGTVGPTDIPGVF